VLHDISHLLISKSIFFSNWQCAILFLFLYILFIHFFHIYLYIFIFILLYLYIFLFLYIYISIDIFIYVFKENLYIEFSCGRNRFLNNNHNIEINILRSLFVSYKSNCRLYRMIFIFHRPWRCCILEWIADNRRSQVSREREKERYEYSRDLTSFQIAGISPLSAARFFPW